MSAQYSTNIRSQYQDPHTHVKNRITEFRLDSGAGQIYLPNLRVVNLGFFTNVATTAHKLLGFESCIRHIRLLDGAVELDSLRFANRYLSFKNQLGGNQNKLCVMSPLAGSSVGYLLRVDDKVDHIIGDAPTHTSESEEKSATLDLRKVFSFLTNIDHLDTNVFKQLKIQIEYETTSELFGLADKSKTTTINTPMLVCDLVVDPKVSDKMRSSAVKQLVFDVIEHDQLTVPDSSASVAGVGNGVAVPQTTAGVVNGFDNKYVGRMVVLKQYNDPAVGYSTNAIIGYGPYSSNIYAGEALSVRKNGVNIFSGPRGLESNGLRQMLLWSAWGDMALSPYAAQHGVGNESVLDATPVNTSGVPILDNAKQSARVGQASYYGFSVEDRCSQLQLSFFKNAYKDAQTGDPKNKAVDLHIYGECRKQLVISGGKYNISYM